jgi:hypothetical protein
VPNNVSGYVEDLWPYETNLEKAREELAQAQVPEGFTVTVPVYAGDLFDEEATVLIKGESGQTRYDARDPEDAHRSEKDAHDQETGRYGGL